MTTKKKLKELKRYVDVSKYDINQRVSMIIDEVEEQLKQMERDAEQVYFKKEYTGV